MATLFINITAVSTEAVTNQLEVTAELKDDAQRYAQLFQRFSINWATATNASVATTVAAAAKTAFEAANGALSLPITYVFVGQTIAIQQGQAPLIAYDPYSWATSSSFSSHQPASVWYNRFALPNAVAMSNANVLKTVSVNIPAGTSTNSSGQLRYSYSHGMTLFSRQDYSNNSTNLTSVATASFGITGSMSWTSGSQTIHVSFVTDTTGGTSVFSTTSSNAAWSSFLSGSRMFEVPIVTTLQPGEYVVAHRHSSTTGTTGSNVTLLSFANGHVGAAIPGGSTMGGFGGTSAAMGFGVGTGVTHTTTVGSTCASLNASANVWYMNFSNN